MGGGTGTLLVRYSIRSPEDASFTFLMDLYTRSSESHIDMYVTFYDDCKNSRAHWLIFIVNKRTDT